uniref:Putative secreted protein n=1 Tax=Rhipicephalus microplus TaxID=6941 RepID=A0A6M2DAP1_RHIMP
MRAVRLLYTICVLWTLQQILFTELSYLFFVNGYRHVNFALIFLEYEFIVSENFHENYSGSRYICRSLQPLQFNLVLNMTITTENMSAYLLTSRKQ